MGHGLHIGPWWMSQLVENPPVRALQWVGLGAGLVSVLAALYASRGPSLGIDDGDGVLLASLVTVGAAAVSVVSAGAALVFARSIRPSVAALCLTLMSAGILAITSDVARFELVLAACPTVVLLGLSLRATVRVRREHGLDPSRRRLQLLLAWCPPYLGAIVVLAFYGAQDNPYVDDGFDANPGNHGYD